MAKERTQEVTPDSKVLRMVKADYKAMYEAAKKTGKLQRPTYRIHTWTDDNALLIGRVKTITEFTDGKFEQACKAYLIETNDGAVSCVLGSYTDAQLEATVKPGTVIAILYLGQKQLEDSRKVNMFDVDIIEESKEPAHADK